MSEIPKVKAIKVTKENASLLWMISGIELSAFAANIGWILVEDWNVRKRFVLIPMSSFKASYPKVELATTLLDK